MSKILLISNGHGEDSIAVNIAKALHNQAPTASIHAFPLVGEGKHYQEAGITVVHKNKALPSGGFIRSFKDLMIDISSGLVSEFRKQKQSLKNIGSDYDTVLAIGDVFCLYMASQTQQKAIFLPTAKSDSFMPHSLIERQLIKKWALKTYTRDKLTSDSLNQYQIKADYLGNPMMDNLITKKKVITAKPGEKIIGILPGSRDEAIKNFSFIYDVCDVISGLSEHKCHFVCALSPTLNIKDIEKSCDATSSQHEYGYLLQSTTVSCLITHEFLSVINQADIIIGLAGTANEQAMELGKTVVAFEGFGPQSTLKRFQEQKQLMRNKLIIVPERHKQAIAKTVVAILEAQSEHDQHEEPQNSSASEHIAEVILSS